MFLGVFILQLFVSILFVLTDLWLHSNVIRIIAVIMLAATCLSVSYTHLDVYKRQVDAEPYPVHDGQFIFLQECGHIPVKFGLEHHTVGIYLSLIHIFLPLDMLD